MKKLYTIILAVLCMQGYAQTFVQKGLDIDGEAAYDFSGFSVSMPDTNTVAIGAVRNDGNGTDAGHVRVYTWNGSAWVQKGGDIDGEAANDWFGFSVSMPDANTVAIGALNNDGNAFNAGHVRVYTWNGSAWVQKGGDIDGEAAGDNSGRSVSMPDANTVAIGANYNDGNGTDAGHVRVYTWNGSAWVQKGGDIDGEAAGDNFGWSVSMPDANTVAIGAIYNDGNGTDAGHVRVYTWNGSAWVQKGGDINGEAAYDFSGFSVSMPDTNTVAIGAVRNDGNGTDAGHVRVYTWNGSAWVQKGGDIDGEAAYDYSGHSVSMPDANMVAIGAIYNDGNGSNSGHVRVYTWNGSAWVQKGGDIDGEAAGDNSGFSVSMPDTNTVAIGAIYNDGNGSDSGHVRVYSPCSPTTSTISPTALCSYTSPSGKYIWTVSGTYMDTIPNAAGCDSIITINLTINQISDQTVSAMNNTFCDSGSTTIILGSSEAGVNYYLRDDANDTIVDGPIAGTGSSISFNTGTINQTMTYHVWAETPSSFGLTGNTLSFDGVNDYLDLPDGIASNANFTFEAWVNYTDNGNWTRIFDFGNGTTTGYMFLTPKNGATGFIRFAITQTDWSGEQLINTYTLMPTGWHHIAVTYDASTTTGRLFLDGVEIGNNTNMTVTPANLGNTTKNYIGKSQYPDPYFKGKIDEIRIWSVARSASEIANNMYTCLSGNESNLVAFYDLEEGTGGIINDKTANAYNGTLTNMNTSTAWVQGYTCSGCNLQMTQTVTITVNQTTYSTISPVACDSYTSPSGNYTWTTSGTYMDTIPNGAGCDSVITINLTVNSTTYSTISPVACDSYTSPSGNYTWTTSGTYMDTIPNGAGCDSVITINLTVNSTTYSTISPVACDSYTSPSGNYTWTTSGTYMDTIPNGAGCDSVITINLTIYNPQYDTLTVSSCDSYTWSQNNMTYTTSGVYYDTITGVVGGVCDSIYVLNLTIYNPQYDTLTVSSCDSYTWMQNGMMYTTSGIYYDTIANAVGGLCDSIYVLNLTIYNPQYDTLTVSSCDSYTWSQNGISYTSSGMYYDTIANAVGGVCDSIYVLNLTIYNPQYDTLTVSSCDSYTWSQNGISYTSSGMYYDTIANAVGGVCDSIYVLNLTIYNPQYDTLTVSSCDSYTWLQNGMMYTTSGVYYDTIANAVGGVCDSIYVLNLTIYNPQYDTLTVSSCDSYTWLQNGMMYTTSGVYYDTIANAVSGVCDSIYVLNLTIKTVDATVTDSLTTLTAVQAGASYQWVLCPGYLPISGATNQSFTAMSNGYYAVIVTLNGCTDTSSCYPVWSVGIKDNVGETEIKLYPNPTIDGHITLQTDRLCEQMQVVIRDVTGKQISVYEFKNTRQADITIEEESKGLYFIEIITKEGIRKNYKVIKQ